MPNVAQWNNFYLKGNENKCSESNHVGYAILCAKKEVKWEEGGWAGTLNSGRQRRLGAICRRTAHDAIGADYFVKS